ncbi:MAG TPA: hypothetical protein VFA65_03505, partial [Bryobacteraceae bacterium]|nr:hypothetical protein [Bryobacteraceae bacterium]
APKWFVARQRSCGGLANSVTAIQAPPELPGRNKNSLGRGGILITGLPEHSTRKGKNELREIDFGGKCLTGGQKKNFELLNWGMSHVTFDRPPVRYYTN